MCGIVGAVAKREVSDILVEGLRRLEYRGYDSAGVAVINAGKIGLTKRVGKVEVLSDALAAAPLTGGVGIAHTRWATHGKPSEDNAHPHLSNDRIALVHNGIIENHEQLREQLTDAGYVFKSQTDTDTNHQRATRACTDNLIRLTKTDNSQTKGALKLFNRRLNRGQ